MFDSHKMIAVVVVFGFLLNSESAELTIDASSIIHSTDRRNLTGSNIALWNQPWELSDPELHAYVRELAPSYVRIPGGSWANHYIWNGNGVNLGGEKFDHSKLKDGVWDVDWSGYAPGFNIEGHDRKIASDNYHGIWHVKQLHDFVETFDANGVVTVNLGSGTPEVAAEWVRWANIKNDYKIKYWELGNELEGSWELGHILPDGTKITGEIFARRFNAFAKAMKAVDPTIKTGGPASSNDRGAFIKEVLRDSGELVDFVSFHSYPVKNRHKEEAEFFNAVRSLKPAMDRIHGWIEQYQPERKGEIEIAITEWNSQVVENRTTADLMNGLWCTMWIGEMFRNGVTFANQWDMITATPTGGHGLFYFDQFDFEQPGVPQDMMDYQFDTFNPTCIPKGQYWALWLWSHWMGDKLVQSSWSGSEDVYSAVTRDEKGLQVLFVNRSRDNAVPVTIQSNEALSDRAAAIQLSHREYFWNPNTHKPQWSRRPEPVEITLGNEITVPPFCALVVQVPFNGNAVEIKQRKNEAIRAPRVFLDPPTYQLLLPESTPEDVPVEAWVLAPGIAPCSAGRPARFVDLKIEGPAEISRSQVRISEGAGRFYITPTGTGTVTITAGNASASLACKAVQERKIVLWPFEEASDDIRSDFDFQLSDTAKPNQSTAAIRFSGIQPAGGSDTLIEFKPIPEHVEKERTGGFSFEIKKSHDLVSADPGAQLQVVLQSESDHWIPIGSLALNEVGTDWRSIEFRINDHKNLPAMKWLYAIRVVLTSSGSVDGEIYLNDAGLILR